ncbi:MAG TPA: glycosyltransferase [Chthoniobacterales bacterium]
MNTAPRVSLLVPCYNAGKHLRGLAEQIAAQELPFAEVICYDDNSQDDTLEVARDLGFSVIAGDTNRGAGFARNRLWESAAMPWIHFHDADDTLSPRYLEKLAVYLGEEPAAVMCAFRKRWSGGEEADLVYRYPDAGTETDWITFFIRHFVHLNAFIFPTEALQTTGGFAEDLRIAEDREFLVRAAAKGLRFTYVDELLVDWVVHKDSTLGRAAEAIRWRYDGIFLRRCYDLLDLPHRKALGEYALYRGWWLFWTGVYPGARENIEVAQLCGVYHADDAKLLEQLLSHTIGTLRCFALKKGWARLKAWLSAKHRMPGSE